MRSSSAWVPMPLTAADDLAGGDAGAERLEHLRLFERSRLQILAQQLVVGLGRGFHQLLAVLAGLVRDVAGDVGLARLPIRVERRLHLDEVDETLERVLLAHGDVERHRAALEPAGDGLQRAIEVGPLAIEAIDDDGAGQLVLVRELPDLLGLNLDAGHGVHHHDGRLDHSETGAGVGDEVAVPRGVHEVHVVALPVTVGHRGVDRDLALDLVRIEVGGRGAVVHLAEPGDRAGRE